MSVLPAPSRPDPATTSATGKRRSPPLENGDHLTRAEFERRYDATPGLRKAELLEGIVYMPPPAVSHDFHSSPHADLMFWLGLYRSVTPGIVGGDNGSLRLDLDNMPQPDAYLLIPHDRGGQSRIDEDHYVAGAPELIAEVAHSSVSYDLHLKLQVYRRNGVREYIVWRTMDREIDWFILREGQYLPLQAGGDGIVRSEVFPGLWLDRAALLKGDLAAVARVVQQGAADPAHTAFAAKVAPAPRQA